MKFEEMDLSYVDIKESGSAYEVCILRPCGDANLPENLARS
jgi:hypothetical protein